MTLSRQDRFDLLRPRLARETPLPPALPSPAAVEQAMVDLAITLLQPGQRFATVRAVAVGDALSAYIEVRHRDGTVTELDAPPDLVHYLAEHKRMSYDPHTGAWLAAEVFVAGPTRFKTSFSTTELPEGTAPITADQLRGELSAFPRPDTAVPAWARALLVEDTRAAG